MAWLELDPNLSHAAVRVDHGVGVDALFKRDDAIAAEMRAHGISSSAETFGDRPMPAVEVRTQAESRVAPFVGPLATYTT